MDILTLLKQDHDSVDQLLSKIFEEESDDNLKLDLFEKIYHAINLHAKIEEKIFYPVVEKHSETKGLTLDAYEEHALIKKLLNEIQETNVQGEQWLAKIKVLKENVEHHVKEEETQLFPRVKKIIKHEVLEKMGLEMLSIKVKES